MLIFPSYSYLLRTFLFEFRFNISLEGSSSNEKLAFNMDFTTQRYIKIFF